jgi:hypothetical protein
MKGAIFLPNSRTNALALSGLLALLGAEVPADTVSATPDRFTATTTAMTPRDVTLRIDVREWSDEAARAEVRAALEQESDVAKALTSLPSVGVAWRSGSAVGYAVKYAHRVATPQGERVTFVTDKRLGAYDLEPWTAEAPAAQPELEYSVIELYLDGNGSGAGTMSLVAAVELDATNSAVSLTAGAPRVLANAKLEPKPYWAEGP